jgi:hypothetical protein
VTEAQLRVTNRINCWDARGVWLPLHRTYNRHTDCCSGTGISGYLDADQYLHVFQSTTRADSIRSPQQWHLTHHAEINGGFASLPAFWLLSPLSAPQFVPGMSHTLLRSRLPPP